MGARVDAVDLNTLLEEEVTALGSCLEVPTVAATQSDFQGFPQVLVLT